MSPSAAPSRRWHLLVTPLTAAVAGAVAVALVTGGSAAPPVAGADAVTSTADVQSVAYAQAMSLAFAPDDPAQVRSWITGLGNPQFDVAPAQPTYEALASLAEAVDGLASSGSLTAAEAAALRPSLTRATELASRGDEARAVLPLQRFLASAQRIADPAARGALVTRATRLLAEVSEGADA